MTRPSHRCHHRTRRYHRSCKAACSNASEFAPWSRRREHAFFYQSDPVNLHEHLCDFDLIVGFDALSHTYRPAAVPAHLASRLSRLHGGVLVLFEPREGGAAVTDETLATVQRATRPGSAEVCELLRQCGCEVLPVRTETFDLFDGVVAPDRVGVTRVALDVIVAIKRAQ